MPSNRVITDLIQGQGIPQTLRFEIVQSLRFKVILYQILVAQFIWILNGGAYHQIEKFVLPKSLEVDSGMFVRGSCTCVCVSYVPSG
jgi:hypothetical protein